MGMVYSDGLEGRQRYYMLNSRSVICNGKKGVEILTILPLWVPINYTGVNEVSWRRPFTTHHFVASDQETARSISISIHRRQMTR